ncbi:hypothetical protein QR685DRAFT_446454, partial [Neurospora intermedia]
VKGMLRVIKRRSFAGKNGTFNVRCHVAVVPLFFVGEGTCRIQEGAGRLSLNHRNIIINLPSSAIPPTATIEALYKAINGYAKSYRFTVNRIQGHGKFRATIKDYIRYYIVCNRFGEVRKSIVTIRKIVSRKYGY